jgi:hypothetical protein
VSGGRGDAPEDQFTYARGMFDRIRQREG